MKQGLLAVVAKLRCMLPNDVIFGKKHKCLNKRRRIDEGLPLKAVMARLLYGI